MVQVAVENRLERTQTQNLIQAQEAFNRAGWESVVTEQTAVFQMSGFKSCVRFGLFLYVRLFNLTFL